VLGVYRESERLTDSRTMLIWSQREGTLYA